MATRMILTGVDELLAEMARLSPDLAAEAVGLQIAAANDTADALRAALPVATGVLRGSVQVQREGSISPARVFTRIAVTAPYAEFVEFGTSRTAPTPAFVPITRRGREAFVKTIIGRVRDRGLTIHGEAA